MSAARSDESKFLATEGSASQGWDYRPDIDGLRAVAVLAVVGYHAFPRLLPGGFVGVDIFFVISGFLISGIVFRGLARGKFSLLDFYIRRVRRIFPALIVVLHVVAVLGWLLLLPNEFQRLGKHLAAGASFLSNIVLYSDANTYFGMFASKGQLIHLWSLGVEEQFYLLWPIFLLFAWRWGRTLFVLILAVAAGSFIVNVIAIPSHPLASFYLPSSRLWELAIGGALAWLQTHDRVSIEKAGTLFSAFTLRYFRLEGHQVQGALGATLLLLSCAGLNSKLAFPGWWALAPSLGALMLIAAGPSSWVNRHLLMPRSMVYIGLISYPLYIWHWPLFSFLNELRWGDVTFTMITGALILSFVLAALTYRYVEIPLRFSARKAPQLAIILSISMIACGSVGWLIFVEKARSRPLTADVSQYLRLIKEPRPDTYTRTDDGFYVFGASQKRALFIGDSTIGHYMLRLAKVVADNPRNSYSAVLALAPACSVAYEMAIGNQDVCKKNVESALKFARSPDVETVVIGAASYLLFVEFPEWEQIGKPAALKAGTDSALKHIEDTMVSLVAQGKRVYLLLPSPVSADYDIRRVIRRSIWSPGFRMEPETPERAAVVEALMPITTKLREAAREAGAIVIDPIDSLCDSVACPGFTLAGEPIYVDAFHLRHAYARDHATFVDETLLVPEGRLHGSSH